MNIEPPYYQDTTFSLSSEADLLYFVSHGSLVSGNVNINAEPTGVQDSISVDLRAYYWSESALDYVSVCEIKSRGVGEGSDRKVKQGVAIFSPRKRFPRARRNVVFDIKIGLPARSYAALTADYSNFRIGLSGLEEKTFFDAITVKTSNSRITVDVSHYPLGKGEGEGAKRSELLMMFFFFLSIRELKLNMDYSELQMYLYKESSIAQETWY